MKQYRIHRKIRGTKKALRKQQALHNAQLAAVVAMCVCQIEAIKAVKIEERIFSIGGYIPSIKEKGPEIIVPNPKVCIHHSQTSTKG